MTNSPVYYGKFSVSWTGNGATDNRRKLQPWLDPAGTNPTTLNGACPILHHEDFSISAMSEGSNVFTLEATANVAGVDQYQWELTQGSGWTIVQHPFSESGKPYMYRVRVTKGPGGSSQAIVRGRPQNCAGWADEWTPTFLPLLSSYSISASLGSGGTTLYVQIDTDSEAYEAALSQSGSGVSTGLTSAPVFTVRLYNSQGIMVRQTTAQAGTATLDIANLPNGYYILQVHDGSANPPQTQNILIYH
jgi:hypothetical protein